MINPDERRGGGATWLRSVVVSRFFVLSTAGLLMAVCGGAGIRGDPRPIVYSDWKGQAEGWQESVGDNPIRVGSFRVGRPETERFVGGLFEEWRGAVLPEFGRFDPLARQGVRDRVFLNREGEDFNEYLRGRREDLLLRFNRASADYLTGALTAGAEAGARRHAFVRNVEWDYQSRLGKRRWQTGLYAVGALRKTADEAVAWQLRGYAAKDSSGGGNAGLIYRRVVNGEALAGLNVFFDYEKHDYGSFTRWSYGGELRGGWIGLYFNRYGVLSSERPLSENRVAYSRDGFDVVAEFADPQFRRVAGGGDLLSLEWRVWAGG